MSSEKARVRLLFRSAPLAPEFGKQQTFFFFFFLVTAFSQAGPSYSSNQRLVYLGAASEQRQAGRERKRACSVRPRCLEAELRDRGRA